VYTFTELQPAILYPSTPYGSLTIPTILLSDNLCLYAYTGKDNYNTQHKLPSWIIYLSTKKSAVRSMYQLNNCLKWLIVHIVCCMKVCKEICDLTVDPLMW